jgi:hypothetical protein
MRKYFFALFVAALLVMPSVTQCQPLNQRFTLVRGEKGSHDEFAYAFDTKTGQMCKAWDWVSVLVKNPEGGGQEKAKGENGPFLVDRKNLNREAASFVFPDLQRFLLCLDLFEKYPDRTAQETKQPETSKAK